MVPLPETPKTNSIVKPEAPNPNVGGTANPPPEVSPTNRPVVVPPIPQNSQLIDDLFIQVESLKLTGDAFNGELRVTLIVKNVNASNTVGIGFSTGAGIFAFPATKILNKRSDEFLPQPNTISGIPVITSGQNFADLKSGGTLVANLTYQHNWNAKSGDYGPYRFQAEIQVGDNNQGRYENVRKLNFVIDIPKATK